MDKIVDGKRRKLLGLKSTKKELRKPLDDNTAEAIKNVEIDRDALFAEEMKKIPKLDPAEALVQIHTGIYYLLKLIIIIRIFSFLNLNFVSLSLDKKGRYS